MCIKGTVISDGAEAQCLDAAVFVGRQFTNAAIVTRETSGGDILDARLDPLDRHPGDYRCHDSRHIARVHRHLVAKAAADVTPYNAYFAFRNPRKHGHHGAHQMWVLRGHVNRQLAAHFVKGSHAATGLEWAWVNPRI